MKSPMKKYRIDYLLSGNFAGFFIILLIIVCFVSYNFSSKELARNTSFYQQELMNELNKQMMLQMRTVEQLSLAIARNSMLLNFLDIYESDYYSRLKAQSDITSYYLVDLINSIPSLQSMTLYVHRSIVSDPKSYVSFVEHDTILSEPWYPQVEKSDFTWLGERTIETGQGPQKVVTFARKIYSSSMEYK
jgi:two-component system sensor histidine kinase YesM